MVSSPPVIISQLPHQVRKILSFNPVFFLKLFFFAKLSPIYFSVPAEIQKSLDIIYGSQGAASHVSNQYRRPAPPTANRRLSAPRRH